MSLTILFRAYYFLPYPSRPLNSERPREERNFQGISKNGAKRGDPFGYGRVKWQESAISGMRPVLDIKEGGTAGVPGVPLAFSDKSKTYFFRRS